MTKNYSTILQLIDSVTLGVLKKHPELLVNTKEVKRLDDTSVRITRKLLELTKGK